MRHFNQVYPRNFHDYKKYKLLPEHANHA